MSQGPYTVVVTRPAGRSEEFEQQCRAAGFEVIHVPVFELRTVPPSPQLDGHLDRLQQGDFDWLVITSSATAESLAQLMGQRVISRSVKLAAIGERSAAACQHFLKRTPDVVAKVSSGLGLAEELARRAPQARAFVPGSNIALGTVTSELKSAGWQVDEAVVYENIPLSIHPDLLGLFYALDEARMAITFFSPSAVRSLMHQPELAAWVMQRQPRVMCIGKLTAQVAQAEGLGDCLAVKDGSSDEMLRALEGWRSERLRMDGRE